MGRWSTAHVCTSYQASVTLEQGTTCGQKKPLEPKHAWSIRVSLEIARSKRNLALFNLAIDSKLRACDLVRLRVSYVDYAPPPHPSRYRLSGTKKEYRTTGNLRAVQLLLGHTKLESTVRYLGIEVDDALNMAEQIDL